MSINLNKESYNKLTKKLIGAGTDGSVYKLSNNKLVKIYHNKMAAIIKANSANETRIYNQSKTKKKHIIEDSISSNDDVLKIYTINPIKEAIRRQKGVKLSKLPIDYVYYNNIFVGCVLERIRGIQLHKLMGLPKNYKLDIFSNIIKEVKELIENNIYPRDIANSPFSINREGSFGHSHILVNPITKSTHIIDLDGNSTIYTEKKNDRLLHETEKMVNLLFIEYFFCILNYINIDLEEVEYDIMNRYRDTANIDELLNLELPLNGLEETIASLRKK